MGLWEAAAVDSKLKLDLNTLNVRRISGNKYDLTKKNKNMNNCDECTGDNCPIKKRWFNKTVVDNRNILNI